MFAVLASMKWPRDNKNTLQHAIGPFLLIAKFFGVMPVSGVWPTSDIAQLEFRLCNIATFVGVFIFLFSILDCTLSARMVLHNGLKIYTIGALSFSVICIACFGIFLLLSRHWSTLIKRTARCELIFLQQQYDCPLARNFSRRLRIWGIILLSAAFAEHMTYVFCAVYNNYLQIQLCNLTVDFWENYFLRERQQLFLVTNFNYWILPFIEWTTFAMTFVWSFCDILLILLSRSMEIRYKQLLWRIKQHSIEHMHNSHWQQIRCDLLSLNDLLKVYDDKLSSLILVSCTHNMYFLCVQIFHSFSNRGNGLDELYFWSTTIYVLARLLTMMLSAASIPETAAEIAYTVFEIPNEYWCLELKRLSEILMDDVYALSGKGFFFLTRRLIFGMAGTMMVYELVLINQMAGADVQKNFCDTGAGSSKSIFS